MSASQADREGDPQAMGYLWTIDDVFALRALQALGGRYLPWSSGAMRPIGLLAVLNEVALGSRERILECGSGLSTIYLARLLAERGGRLVSLEHSPEWAAYVESQLAAEQLDGVARVMLAPLERDERALDGGGWYRRSAAEEALESLGGPADLLVVDGPPADRPEIALSRYPALPFASARLARDAIVVLDDSNRPGEGVVLERWSAESRFEFERRADLGWIAIGRPADLRALD